MNQSSSCSIIAVNSLCIADTSELAYIVWEEPANPVRANDAKTRKGREGGSFRKGPAKQAGPFADSAELAPRSLPAKSIRQDTPEGIGKRRCSCPVQCLVYTYQ